MPDVRDPARQERRRAETGAEDQQGRRKTGYLSESGFTGTQNEVEGGEYLLHELYVALFEQEYVVSEARHAL